MRIRGRHMAKGIRMEETEGGRNAGGRRLRSGVFVRTYTVTPPRPCVKGASSGKRYDTEVCGNPGQVLSAES